MRTKVDPRTWACRFPDIESLDFHVFVPYEVWVSMAQPIVWRKLSDGCFRNHIERALRQWHEFGRVTTAGRDLYEELSRWLKLLPRVLYDRHLLTCCAG